MSKKNRDRRAQERAEAQVDVVAAEEYEQKRRTAITYIMEQQKFRARQDMLTLRVAIDMAENPKNPNREMLHRIFDQCDRDPSLTSNFESRKMKVKEKPFRLMKPTTAGKKAEEDKEATEILEQDWFYDWIDACLDSRKWQYSLIEFGELDTAAGEFKPYTASDNRVYDAITVIERDNVKPEFGIITKTPGDIDGKPFSYFEDLMFVGSHRKIKDSILWKAARYILYKDNLMANWSEWAELFAMDKRIGRTAAEGEDRKIFAQAMRDLGTSSYGVFGLRDEIEFVGTSRTDAYGVYKAYIDYIDQQIAKLVFGQDVVQNNTGKVVGSVGENIANMYGDTDAKFIKGLVNRKLFPLMEKLGFTRFAGLKFDWDTTEKLTLMDRATVDKQISDMGFKHSVDYINNTYGTEVEEKEDPAAVDPNKPGKVNEDISAQYE
jgi:phage gp29-like protein